MFTLADDSGPILHVYWGMPDGNALLADAARRFVVEYGLTGIRTTLPDDYLTD
jgi:hypothetical protein